MSVKYDDVPYPYREGCCERCPNKLSQYNHNVLCHSCRKQVLQLLAVGVETRFARRVNEKRRPVRQYRVTEAEAAMFAPAGRTCATPVRGHHSQHGHF